MIQLTRDPAVSPVRLEARSMHDTSWVEINLSRLDHNLAAFRQLIGADRPGGPGICAVVKANAYGLGAVAIAKRLIARGVNMLAVFSPTQAEELVRHAVHCPILLLMPLRSLKRQDLLYRPAAAGTLHLSLHDVHQLGQVSAFAQMLGLNVPLHLYYDTGMSRAGLNRQDMIEVLHAIPHTRNVHLAGIYTHLATAGSDEAFARRQLEELDLLLEQHRALIPRGTIIHVANTSGALRDRRFHKSMIRIGLGLYGYGPDLLTGGSVIGDMSELQPVVRWMSRVVHVARYPAGATVGYDATHTLHRDSVLGLVPAGYADGYPVSLSNRSMVCVPALRTGPSHPAAPVLGRVSMEQIVIDLTDLVNAIDPSLVRTGDAAALSRLLQMEVELISDDPTSPCSLPALAEAAQTNCYELLCRIAPWVPRRYITPEVRAVALATSVTGEHSRSA